MERITSRRNPLCLHIKKLGAARSYRESCGQFVCDGIKLLEEAVMCDAEICAVLTSTDIPFALSVDSKVYYAARDIIDSLSPLQNSQGVLFTSKIPQKNSLETISALKGTHILLDGVQDPGNVGTIIRTASAFGIRSVILTGGCADPYNPKTIRATMGAIFKQVLFNVSSSKLDVLRESGRKIIGTVLDGDCSDISEINLKDAIIAIGNEGCGLSSRMLSLCSEKIKIPILPECESLNAAIAAAIIMWEAYRT